MAKLADLNALINTSTDHLNAFKAIALAYEFGSGGVPNINGFVTLIENAIDTNFGAGDGPVFNQENIFINVLNAQVQGNTAAAAKFAAVTAGGATLQDKLTLLYNAYVPVEDQTDAGREFFTRAEAQAFYEDVAADRGVAGPDGAAIVALASLLNILTNQDIGLGDDVNDLREAIRDGSAVLPEDGADFTPIEVADGDKYDGDEPQNNPATTLTTGFDTLVGTAGDDLFSAPLHYGADDQVQTLTVGDTIDGGEGHDTLEAQLYGQVTAPKITNVETLSFRAFSGSSVDARDVTGAKEIVNNRSSSGLHVDNIQNIVTASIVQNNNNTNTILEFANSVLAGDADETTVTFDHSEDVGDVWLGAQSSDNGFETLNVVVTGEAGNVTEVDSIASGTTLATLNIDNRSDDHLFEIETTLWGVTAIDASASVGDVSVIADFTEDVAVTGGAGDDFFDFNTGLTSGDTVDGGDGYDSLRVSGTALGPDLKVSNVEELRIVTVGNGVYNLDNLGAGEGDLKRIELQGNGLAVTLNNVNAGVDVGVVSNVGNLAINIPSASAPGAINDSLNLDLVGGADIIGALTVNGIENLNINSIADAPLASSGIGSIVADRLQVLTITGDTDLTINGVVGGTTIELVNAADFTDNLRIAVADGRGGAVAGRADDVGVDINGGSGNNTIFAGQWNDTIVTQGGDDSITAGNGADVITTGGGQDTLVYTAYLHSALQADATSTFLGIDHVTDFQAGANGDVFDFSNAAFALAAGDADIIQSASIVSSTNAGLGAALELLEAGGAIDFAAGSRFAVVTVQGGEAAGTYLVTDSNGSGIFSAANDIVINITGISGALDASNFIL